MDKKVAFKETFEVMLCILGEGHTALPDQTVGNREILSVFTE